MMHPTYLRDEFFPIVPLRAGLGHTVAMLVAREGSKVLWKIHAHVTIGFSGLNSQCQGCLSTDLTLEMYLYTRHW